MSDGEMMLFEVIVNHQDCKIHLVQAKSFIDVMDLIVDENNVLILESEKNRQVKVTSLRIEINDRYTAIIT